MTKKEMFALIATVNADNTDIVEFCNREIELLNKRVSSKKPTKVQVANIGLMDAIGEVLGNAEAAMTVGEIIAADARLEGLTSQKMSALLTKMCKDGQVVKTYEKKKAYFSIA